MLNLVADNVRTTIGRFSLVSALALAGGCSTKALDQGGTSDGETGDSTAASAGGTDGTGGDSGTTAGGTTAGTSTTAMGSASSGNSTGANGTAGTTGETEGTAGTEATDATDTTDSSSGSGSGSTSTTGQPEDCVGLDEATCEATPGCYAYWGWPVLEMNGGLCTGDEMFVECGPDPGGCDDVISYGCDANDDVLQFPDSCLPSSLEPCDVDQFPEPC